MRILGFTGSRGGCTAAQLVTLENHISLLPDDWQGLHGDCVGADEQFDELCKQYGIATVCRPCTLSHLRAYAADPIAEPTNAMARNRAIAATCEWLFACPPTKEELKRGSGTWATIRYGKKNKKPVTIIYPDGSEEGILT